jgi:lauroyl/myristoyl acyltransferase
MYSGIMYRLELAVFHLIVVPLIAFLPASIAYRLACFRGDLRYRWHKPMRDEITSALESVFGEKFTEMQRLQVARRFIRLRSCEAVDLLRISLGGGNELKKLVEIRGLNYLEESLSKGNGAILGGAHYGSYQCCFALLGSRGFPVTIIGRWPSNNPKRGFFERFVYKETLERPVMQYLHRPSIEPWSGQFNVAVRAAKILKENEVIGTLLDPYPAPVDLRRAVSLNLLNGNVRLLPGSTAIAQLTRAPILVTLMTRGPDWAHQTLEISPPIEVQSDLVSSFAQCLSVVEEAIKRDPAQWIYWNLVALAKIGRLPSQMVGASSVEDMED